MLSTIRTSAKSTLAIAIVFSSFSLTAVFSRGDEPEPVSNSEVRRGLEMDGTSEERAQRAYERAIKKIEPDLVGKPGRLPLYLELFKREFVVHTRTMAFDASATVDAEGRVKLIGWFEIPEHNSSIVQLLDRLGFKDVDDSQMVAVPGPALCDNAYAIVGDKPAFLYDRAKRETYTEALPGDALFVLKEMGDGTLLCHAADGYVGIIDAAKVRRVGSDEFDQYMRSRPVPADRAARIETAIAAAEKYLGTKYVWGGRTKDGIDCSGLVHTAMKAAGVNMPRDADQQVLVGTLVATHWHRSSLARGDVLFFVSKRGTISHTGLYLGDGKFIEAANPVVKITDLNEIPAGKDKARGDTLCFGKRVLE